MKQVQSATTLDSWIGRGKVREATAARRYRDFGGHRVASAPSPVEPSSWSWTGRVITLLSTTWFAIGLPFRMVFWVIALLGRLTGVVLGFALMVVGMALWASPLFIVGIPLFVVGLVLMLRSLE